MRLSLTHLTFTGTNVEPASVSFSPHVTLVRGPSDTGKSFIVNALDFMLGASTLKDIPERARYSTVLLGLKLSDGSKVTLSRSVAGGAFGLWRSDVRSNPTGLADETLSPKHNASSEANLSRFLLGQIGLDGRRVRRNARNDTDSLSFRNLAHLCLVDETQMQSEIPPPLTGNYVSKTKELSVFKLLLEDHDDSDLTPSDAKDKKGLSSAKLEVVDGLIAELEGLLADSPGETELRDQAARLQRAIADQGSAIGTLAAERGRLLEALRGAQADRAGARAEIADARDLRARFTLLQQQYESDLARLAMVEEAGTLLGYFRTGVCVFCGAETKHQHYNVECDGDTTNFARSVQAEAKRTKDLRTDLVQTLDDVDQDLNDMRQSAVRMQERTAQYQVEIDALDQQLAPGGAVLQDLLSTKNAVDWNLQTYARIAELQLLRASILADADDDAAVVAAGLQLSVVREFSSEVATRLQRWGYPGASEVRYDPSSSDLIANDQLRSAHGKGVRAILHAAFTLGLASYCDDRELPHPGFVVLDSPLVTYRPPDSADDEAEGNPPADVVDAFYSDLQSRFTGQAIVFENTDPAQPLLDQTADVVFTKVPGEGRYGFFPHL